MKLLMCFVCNSIFGLSTRMQKCQCKLSSGKFESDGLNATYSGPCLLMGFNNHSYIPAARTQLIHGDEGLEQLGFGVQADQLRGREFHAFMIPESAKTIRRIGKRPTFEQTIALKHMIEDKKRLARKKDTDKT